MEYKYAKEHLDYSDLSSGRVLYSLAGHPAFPVRLASEIFQRCLAHRERLYGPSAPCAIYDPCCGAAYHLTVLAFLHAEHIREAIASDVDEKAVELAARNLRLLSPEGLDRRIDEIKILFEKYGKTGHREALQSAYALREDSSAIRERHSLQTKTFQASATDGEEMRNHIKRASVDLVLTDIPYGQHSRWQTAGDRVPLHPPGSMLDALLGVLSASSIVAVISDKQQKARHESYQRLEQFQVGKRRVVILKPA